MPRRYRLLTFGVALAGLLSLGGGYAYHSLWPRYREAALAEALRAQLDADSTTAAVGSVKGVALHPALDGFYAARGWRLAWTDGAARDTLHALVAGAADDVLDPADYHADALEALARVAEPDDRTQVERDLLLTDAFLRLADDLDGPRVDADSLYGPRRWNAAQRPAARPDTTAGDTPEARLAAALASPAPAAAVAAALDGFRPPHPEYHALRTAYGRLRAAGAPADSLATLALNLERWRWLPDSLGGLHVLVNIPAYRLALREHAPSGWADVLGMRVVVGLPGWKTPAFSDTITQVVFNPTWTIPPSIQREQYGHYRGVVVQPAGPRNPLRRAKFVFPNPHAVYLHDTTSRWGFAREERALSHGCIRLGAPDSLAAALLPRAADGWTEEEAFAAWGGPWRTRGVDLDRPVPVHLVYFTAWPTADGGVTYYEDVYGHDAPLADALAARTDG